MNVEPNEPAEHGDERMVSMPLGIVLRRSPGVTRWASWSWRAVGVLPGAGPARWRELRREGEVVEYHAATVPLELYRAEAEAYLAELQTDPPSIYVVLRRDELSDAEDEPIEVLLATASPYEAQDYADAGDDMVEQVPMPPALRAWVEDYAARHSRGGCFVKRQRDEERIDLVEDGVGDPRIRQASDVYRAPARARMARMTGTEGGKP